MHDFDRFPELTNGQMSSEYFNSPHKQILEDFIAVVTKVIDGDTVKVKWSERDFEFPIRFIDIAAPEKKEPGGLESLAWLSNLILGEEVYVRIDPKNRVEKWGRILGYLTHAGVSVGEMSKINGHSVSWGLRSDGMIPELRELKL